MILTPDELEQLTGAKRSDAQARELEHLGVPYQKRRDGSIIVLRANVHATTENHRPTSPALRLP